MPDLDKFSENSKAPDKFEVSDSPTDLILFFLQKSLSVSIFTVPSQTEYWVWTFKWFGKCASGPFCKDWVWAGCD